MKRYCKKFVFTEEYIRKCLSDCLKRRWRRKDVAYFLAGYAIRHKMTDKSLHDAAKSIRHYVYSDAKARTMCRNVANKIISRNGMVKNSDSVMISRKYNIKRTLNRAKEVIRCEAKAILPAV